MSTEAPRLIKELHLQLQHPYAVLEFLTTPNMQIVEVQKPTSEEVTHAILERTVIIKGEPIKQRISAFHGDLIYLDTFFSGIIGVEPGSPVETAQQNFLAVRLAILNFKP